MGSNTNNKCDLQKYYFYFNFFNITILKFKYNSAIDI